MQTQILCIKVKSYDLEIESSIDFPHFGQTDQHSSFSVPQNLHIHVLLSDFTFSCIFLVKILISLLINTESIPKQIKITPIKSHKAATVC